MKHIKRNIYGKLILLEVVVTMLMSFLVPKLSNYPPNSENMEFQKQIEPLTHNMQYLLLGSLGIILYIFFVRFILKDVFKYIKNYNKVEPSFQELEHIRKKCFSFQKQIVFVQLIAIIVILIILFSSMKLDLHLICKFLLIYFSFFSVAGLLSGILVQSDIDTIIKSTYNINNNYAKIKHPTKFSRELLYNLLPFFIVLLITVSLLGYSRTCNSIGEENYYYYKLYVNSLKCNGSTINELKNLLSSIPLKNNDDYYFIISDEDTIISNSTGNISDFFLKYANMYLDKTDGRVYEYYGVEQEGYVKSVTLNNGKQVYIGFKYSTTNSQLIRYFFTISIVSTIFYTFILIIWSKKVSRNIIQVADSLSEIADQKVTNFKNLPITDTNEIGQLTVAFNDIQKITKKNINTIQANQNQLIEQERLASLGQMIGGIAHNLKTPIMSISGASEGLSDLITELNNSIGNPIVTNDDFHDIANDMSSWVKKIKDYTEYMSDIITAVKGQAVNLSEAENISFDLDELVKRIDILMKHELKNAIIYLNVHMYIDSKIIIRGDVNSLVQVINNMISNAIQAYNGKTEEEINLDFNIDNNNLIISIEDHANGLPQKVKDKLFKEMITTKGKNGTGLGLYMSYSTIKAHFNGNITFESEEGKGTKFNIILPL